MVERNVLRRIIDLSHLIGDGDSSWEEFDLVGLRRGKLYMTAYKNDTPEIAVFNGSSLLPDSWKLINRYPMSDFTSIDTRTTRAVFNNNLTQIGLNIRGRLHDSAQGYSFVLFDLNSSDWDSRIFTWHDPLLYMQYYLAHTCVGWIRYPDFIPNDNFRSIERLSLDPREHSNDILVQLPQEFARFYASLVFVDNDHIYCFSDHYRRSMYICYLNMDGFPSERYFMDSGIEHIRFGVIGGMNKFQNNAFAFRGDICDCILYGTCPGRQSATYFNTVYTAVFEWEAKLCRIKKIAQFRDNWNYIGLDGLPSQCPSLDGLLTKTKRFALVDKLRLVEDKLYLETVFYKPPTLKELSSLALMKLMCHKSIHTVQLINGDSLDKEIWSGGLSEEIKDELGLNNPGVKFGLMAP